MEKQLEQLSCFINRVASDVRLKPTHTSLYLALCDSWIGSRFSNTFHVSRRKLMKAAHIQSIVTYHKVIAELQAFGYLHYLPSCTRRVTVRINEKTFQRLKTLAATCNWRSVGGVVKCLLTNQQIMVLYRDQAFDECVQQLIRIREELRAIGVNINQITRYFHSCESGNQKLFHALEVGEEYAKVNVKVEELIDKVHEIGRMWLDQPRKGERKKLDEM